MKFNKFENNTVNISSHEKDSWVGTQTIEIGDIPISVNFSVPVDALNYQPSIKASGVYVISVEDYTDLPNGWEERHFLDWPTIYVGSTTRGNSIRKRVGDFYRELRRGRDGRTDSDNGRHSSAWALHDKLSESELSKYLTYMTVSYASFDHTTVPENVVNDVIRFLERGLLIEARLKWPNYLSNLT